MEQEAIEIAKRMAIHNPLGGRRSKTSQTRIKHTPVIEKDEEKYKSKLRGLEDK